MKSRVFPVAVCATLALGVLALPAPAAAINVDELEGSSWYLHIDFDTMRKSEAGKGIYAWMDKDILTDIQDDTGLDLRGKLRRLTAFGEGEDDAVVDLEGKFDSKTRNKMLELASDKAKKKTHRGKSYYRVEEEKFESEDGKVEIDLEDEWFITFAFENRIVIAQSEKQMKSVLDGDGKLPTRGGAKKAIFVLSTEKRLVQAGANADRIRQLDPGEDWDSNILKNTKKVGLLVADQDGKLAIDLRLQASKPDMAMSLRNIVLGLIGLSAFNEDIPPELGEILRGTHVTVEDNVLRLRVAAAPQAFIDLIEN